MRQISWEKKDTQKVTKSYDTFSWTWVKFFMLGNWTAQNVTKTMDKKWKRLASDVKNDVTLYNDAKDNKKLKWNEKKKSFNS